MHPRNPYRNAPDFASLADDYPPLKPHLLTTSRGTTIDFKDETSQRRLTEALLYRDFQISLVIPDDRLCPPVPNRLNYILWIQDILSATYLAEPLGPRSKVAGIDIGTGASAIYPLVGCQTNDRWRFFATDVDEQSLHYARLNVDRNHLQERIAIVQSDPSGPIILHLMSEGFSSTLAYDFTMCNPPFYSSREDIVRSAEAKEFDPTAVCTGADVEMITPGGEAAFVCKIVHESLQTRTRCRWYTSMLGKLSSLTEVVALLREQHIDNYACTEFVQGHTRRWAIAWSFGDVRLPDSIARISNPTVKNLMPLRNTFQETFPQAQSVASLGIAVGSAIATIEDISIRSLNSQTQPDLAHTDVLVSLTRDTWSRAARRKKANSTVMQTDPQSQPLMGTALICRITCVEAEHDSGAGRTRLGGPIIRFDWVRGRERALFESFVNHVERKVTALLTSNSALM